MKQTDPFFDYIDNTKGRNLNALKSLIDRANEEPSLINIFVAPSDKSNPSYVQDEQSRMGGFGKSYLASCSWNYYYQKHEPDLEIMPLVDLAVQYTTVKDILSEIGSYLGFSDGLEKWVDKDTWTKSEKERFIDIFVNRNDNNSDAEYDPSYVAAQLFTKLVLNKKADAEYKTKVIFIDSTDLQWLGDDSAPLRQQLTNNIIPFLIEKMGISVFVSGREPLKWFSSESPRLTKIDIKEFQLERFSADQCEEYIRKYAARRHEGGTWENYFDHFEDKQIFETLTGGKAILLDLLADLLYRECVEKKTSSNFKEVFKNIQTTYKDEKDPVVAFKRYAIDRMHNQGVDMQTRQKYAGDLANTVFLLSIAKHGLDAEDLVRLRFFNEDYSSDAVSFMKDFFRDIFNEDNLSYVKGRGNGDRDRRRLHDEMVELFQEYYFGKLDPKHIDRNNYLDKLFLMYSKGMADYTRNHDRFPRLLLEYLDYLFSYRDQKKEQQAINRYLYEFSYYLNRYDDLSARLLEKARHYYESKKEEYTKQNDDSSNINNENTISFKKDFNLLAKLRLREAHYWLTVQRPQKTWKSRINDILQDITKYTSLLEHHHNDGLKARRKVIEGELEIWQSEGETARKLLLEARDLFYQTGDSHGLIWVEHLLGFESQRRGRFMEAESHHRAAIESALLFSETVLKKSYKERFYNNDKSHLSIYDTDMSDWMHRLRLRQLIEVLNRAGSNLAVRQRFDGKMIYAIKALDANLEVAELSGMRERIRTEANLAQYAIIIGREYFSPLNLDESFEPDFDDPLLRRRFPLTKAIHITKKIGLETRMHKSFKSNLVLNDRLQHKINQLKPEIIQISERMAKAMLPPKSPFWMHDEFQNGDYWKVWNPLTEISNHPLAQVSFSREIADIYYQYGKMVLTAQFVPPKAYCGDTQNWQMAAESAFNNARIAAEKSGFLYSYVASCETLYRLTYLLPDHLGSKRKEYKGFYDKSYSEMDAERDANGLYMDITARGYITNGDYQLSELIKLRNVSPHDFAPAIQSYATALWEAFQHNEERYNFVLNIFTNRLREMLLHVRNTGNDDKRFAAYFIEHIISQTEIYQNDSSFFLYVGYYLKALQLEFNNKIKPNKIAEIRKGIRSLSERSAFACAADVNESIINLYSNIKKEKGLDKEEEFDLALSCFQQAFCFQNSNQWGGLKTLLDQTIQLGFNVLKPHKQPTLSEALIFIARGTAIYRTSEFWNVEKFLPNELIHNRKDQQKFMRNLNQAREFYLPAIEVINKEFHQNIENNEKSPNNQRKIKTLTKLLAEAYFRLGELYILRGELEETQANELVHLTESTLNLISNHETYFGDHEFKVNKEFIARDDKWEFKGRYDDSLALRCLNCCYFLSKWISDDHRIIDSLQSIAMARYSMKDNPDFRIIKLIHNDARDNDPSQQNPVYPVLAAKSYLVEGNAIFSQCFKSVENQNDISGTLNRVQYILSTSLPNFTGAPDQNESEIERQWSRVKSQLHQMMWAYLKGLDLLVTEGRGYENYHFRNMAFEVNRRMLLIRDHRLIHMILEDLPIIWSAFPKLNKKRDTILKSMLQDLRVHELAMAAHEIFDESKPATEK